MLGLGISARAGEAAQTRVALLDGVPVYHWRVFTSGLANDVDRALVLREFRRRGYRLPPAIVEDALRAEIDRRHGGDKRQLVESLNRQGVSLEDFRRFLIEEISLSAMRFHYTRGAAGGTQPPLTEAQWLAGLRKGARVEKLPSDAAEDRK